MDFQAKQTIIGVVSDTHGSLPDGVLRIFAGEYADEQVVERLFIDHASEQVLNGNALEPAPCTRILHAGDIGNPSGRSQGLLDALSSIAPVTAVLGNCDYPGYECAGDEVGQWAHFIIDGVSFAMLHRPEDLRQAVYGGFLNPAFISPMPRVRIHGHTHVERLERSDNGGIVMNPGSPSRPRGRCGRSVGIIRTSPGGLLLSAEIVRL